ncbi:Cytochrome c oxidase subunit 6B [Basidiobolus ranarum]|uniref:Cytochrome c oxidase subunit n=1 Tax=Basidiobolus ranarum TaxID=34480 RepID=A0ABR2WRM4_9FUNG
MSEETEPNINLKTVSFDARFPNQNQTKHCWQNYVDYYKCITARGENFSPCKQFYRSFRSLCPDDWIDRWDQQREAGTNPSDMTP